MSDAKDRLEIAQELLEYATGVEFESWDRQRNYILSAIAYTFIDLAETTRKNHTTEVREPEPKEINPNMNIVTVRDLVDLLRHYDRDLPIEVIDMLGYHWTIQSANRRNGKNDGIIYDSFVIKIGNKRVRS